jgi:hypothetical protein
MNISILINKCFEVEIVDDEELYFDYKLRKDGIVK